MGLTSAQEGWSSTMIESGRRRIMSTGGWMKPRWCAERWTVEILWRSLDHSVKATIREAIRSVAAGGRALCPSARWENTPGTTMIMLKRPLLNVQVRQFWSGASSLTNHPFKTWCRRVCIQALYACRFPGNVKLAEGHNRCAGRVEFYDKGQWGTVCGESWDINDATVVCRQLDCGRVHKITTMNEFGHGTGHNWVEQIECSGSESTLAQCARQPYEDRTCNTTSIAGVICIGKHGHILLFYTDLLCLRLVLNRCFKCFDTWLHREFGDPVVEE